MMTRTQIYLPEEVHEGLLRLARQQNTTLSNLVRHGANLVLKRQQNNKKLKAVLQLLANPPKKYRASLTGEQLINLVSRDRDD